MSRPRIGSVSPTAVALNAISTVIHDADATMAMRKAISRDPKSSSLGITDEKSTRTPLRLTKTAGTLDPRVAHLALMYKNANASVPDTTNSAARATSDFKNTDSKWI